MAPILPTPAPESLHFYLTSKRSCHIGFHRAYRSDS